VQLGERRVLHDGRWRWLRTLAWLLLLLFLTAAAFGLPLQAAGDLLPPGNGAPELVEVIVACAVTLGSYALAVWVGEGRGPSELALRPALSGLARGAGLGALMMAVLMGVLAVTGLYDLTLVGATPAWTGLGHALQAAVTVAGLMFCALYALTGRLWVPIGLHLAWNFAHGYLFGATVSGNSLAGSIAVSTARPGAPAWLTGGTFGPEASVLALILVRSVTLAALLIAKNARRLAGLTAPTQPPHRAPIVSS